jgi:NAD(P)-dependent dehydrogenase (short-subunit alcohol dehydrogenase family)
MSNEPRTDTSGPSPVAVVTGASQGLGRALTAALVERGWHVVVDARRSDRLADAVTTFGADNVTPVVGDVTDPDHRDALVAAARRQSGPIRLLVNNASTLGASPLPPLDAVTPAVLERTFAVNVVAPVALTAALLPELAPSATVVNITSDAAVEAYEGWGAYGSTKAALEHVSRVLAVEHPEVRVLAVDPGDLRTEMHQDAFPDEDISDRPPPESAVPGLLTLIEGEQPSGRYAASAVAVAP